MGHDDTNEPYLGDDVDAGGIASDRPHGRVVEVPTLRSPINAAREIAARVWCDVDMCKIAMDVEAAEEIATIIARVRRKRLAPLLTPEEAEAAFNAAPEVPLSDKRIQEIVDAATCTVPNRRNFDDELVCLINKYSKENGSNTPDFILADYIGRCLENWNLTVVTREEWFGRSFSPGCLTPGPKPGG